MKYFLIMVINLRFKLFAVSIKNLNFSDKSKFNESLINIYGIGEKKIIKNKLRKFKLRKMILLRRLKRKMMKLKRKMMKLNY